MPRPFLTTLDLFDGSLDFEGTYTPKGQPSFTVRAIPTFSGYRVGAEAGKGLPRSIREYHGDFKHFRVPISTFTAEAVTPDNSDIFTDDEGNHFVVKGYQKSPAGTYELICVAEVSNKGVPSGVTRR